MAGSFVGAVEVNGGGETRALGTGPRRVVGVVVLVLGETVLCVFLRA